MTRTKQTARKSTGGRAPPPPTQSAAAAVQTPKKTKSQPPPAASAAKASSASSSKKKAASTTKSAPKKSASKKKAAKEEDEEEKDEDVEMKSDADEEDEKSEAEKSEVEDEEEKKEDDVDMNDDEEEKDENEDDDEEEEKEDTKKPAKKGVKRGRGAVAPRKSGTTKITVTPASASADSAAPSLQRTPSRPKKTASKPNGNSLQTPAAPAASQSTRKSPRGFHPRTDLEFVVAAYNTDEDEPITESSDSGSGEEDASGSEAAEKSEAEGSEAEKSEAEKSEAENSEAEDDDAASDASGSVSASQKKSKSSRASGQPKLKNKFKVHHRRRHTGKTADDYDSEDDFDDDERDEDFTFSGKIEGLPKKQRTKKEPASPKPRKGRAGGGGGSRAPRAARAPRAPRAKKEKAPKVGGRVTKKKITLKPIEDDELIAELAKVKDTDTISSTTVDVSCCSRCSSREAFRAVNTKSLKLLEAVCDACTTVSNPFLQWSADCTNNAIQEAIKLGDRFMVRRIIQEMNMVQWRSSPNPNAEFGNNPWMGLSAATADDAAEKRKPPQQRVGLPTNSLQKIDTGKASYIAYGHRVAQVNVSRGGKEGNNAFTYDNESESEVADFDSAFLYLMKYGTNTDLIQVFAQAIDPERTSYDAAMDAQKMAEGKGAAASKPALKKQASKLKQQLAEIDAAASSSSAAAAPVFTIHTREDRVHSLLSQQNGLALAIEYGNLKMARAAYAFSAKRAGATGLAAQGPYGMSLGGFNQLHEESLQSTGKSFTEKKFKPASATKKGGGNYSLTPCHFAAINPDLRYLKDLCECLTAPSFMQVTDDYNRTPVFYAAVCSSSEPLQWMIQNGANIFAVDKRQMTPLDMAIAAGAYWNIPLLVPQVPNTTLKGEESDAPASDAEGAAAAAAPASDAEGSEGMGDEDDEGDGDDDDDGGSRRKRRKKAPKAKKPAKAKKVALNKQPLYLGPTMPIHQTTLNNKHKKTGLTIFHKACELGNSKVVKALIDVGADIFAADKEKRTGLVYACQQGHLKVVKVLFEEMMKRFPNDKERATQQKRLFLALDKMHRLPHFHAVKNGHFELVRYLLTEVGLPVDAEDSSSNNLVHYAAAYGWSSLVSLLTVFVKHAHATPETADSSTAKLAGAGNIWKTTSLFISMLKGHLGAASVVLSSPGVDLNCRDSDGCTILHHVIRSRENNLEQCKKQLSFLLEKGADCTLRDGKQKQNILHMLCGLKYQFATADEDIALAEMFLTRGINVDDVDGSGQTALMILLSSQQTLHPELITYLLEKGAACNISYGAARDNGVTSIMKLLKISRPSPMNEEEKKAIEERQLRLNTASSPHRYHWQTKTPAEEEEEKKKAAENKIKEEEFIAKQARWNKEFEVIRERMFKKMLENGKKRKDAEKDPLFLKNADGSDGGSDDSAAASSEAKVDDGEGEDEDEDMDEDDEDMDEDDYDDDGEPRRKKKAPKASAPAPITPQSLTSELPKPQYLHYLNGRDALGTTLVFHCLTSPAPIALLNVLFTHSTSVDLTVRDREGKNIIFHAVASRDAVELIQAILGTAAAGGASKKGGKAALKRTTSIPAAAAAAVSSIDLNTVTRSGETLLSTLLTQTHSGSLSPVKLLHIIQALVEGGMDLGSIGPIQRLIRKANAKPDQPAPLDPSKPVLTPFVPDMEVLRLHQLKKHVEGKELEKRTELLRHLPYNHLSSTCFLSYLFSSFFTHMSSRQTGILLSIAARQQAAWYQILDLCIRAVATDKKRVKEQFCERVFEQPKQNLLHRIMSQSSTIYLVPVLQMLSKLLDVETLKDAAADVDKQGMTPLLVLAQSLPSVRPDYAQIVRPDHLRPDELFVSFDDLVKVDLTKWKPEDDIYEKAADGSAVVAEEEKKDTEAGDNESMNEDEDEDEENEDEDDEDGGEDDDEDMDDDERPRRSRKKYSSSKKMPSFPKPVATKTPAFPFPTPVLPSFAPSFSLGGVTHFPSAAPINLTGPAPRSIPGYPMAPMSPSTHLLAAAAAAATAASSAAAAAVAGGVVNKPVSPVYYFTSSDMCELITLYLKATKVSIDESVQEQWNDPKTLQRKKVKKVVKPVNEEKKDGGEDDSMTDVATTVDADADSSDYNSEDDDTVATNGASSSSVAAPSLAASSTRKKPPCQYGARCYRVNPLHMEQFSHPGDVVVSEAVVENGEAVEFELGEFIFPEQMNLRQTFLHQAVYHRSSSIVSFLLTKGANVLAKDYKQRIPLHIACKHEDTLIPQALLGSSKKEEQLLAQDSTGAHALTIVAQSMNKTALAKLLLQSIPKKQVDLRDNSGRTPLHYAVNYSARRHGDESARGYEMAFGFESCLLEFGADINVIDNDKRTVLHYVFIGIDQVYLTQGQPATDPIELVSDICAVTDPSKKGKTSSTAGGAAPSSASLDRSKSFIHKSAECYVSVDIPDVYGRTPVMYAAMAGAQICVKYAVQRGANLKRLDSEQNGIFQHALYYKRMSLAVDLVDQKVEFGAMNTYLQELKKQLAHKDVDPEHALSLEAQIKAGSAKQMSTFGYVLSQNWIGCAYLMMDMGISILLAVKDALDNNLLSLVHTLITKTPPSKLVEYDASTGRNLFHILTSYQPRDNQAHTAFEQTWSIQWAELLLSSGVDCDSVEKVLGFTPLHFACMRNHTRLIDLLLRKQKVRNNIVSLAGYTPLMEAARAGHLYVLQTLHSFDNNIFKAAAKEGTTQAKDGTTALHWSCASGDFRMTDYLLQQGVEVNPVLNTAAQKFDPTNKWLKQDADAVLQHKREKMLAGMKSWTRVHSNNVKSAKYLHPLLPLQLAVLNSNYLLLRLLLACGANPNLYLVESQMTPKLFKRARGATVLMYACLEQDDERLVALLCHERDPTIVRAEKAAAKAKHAYHPQHQYEESQIAQARAKTQPTDFNLVDTDGRTLLHRIIIPLGPGEPSYEDTTLLREVVRLSRNGKNIAVDMEIKDKAGKTALDYAMLQASGKMKKVLIELGAKVDKQAEKAANETLAKSSKSALVDWSAIPVVDAAADAAKVEQDEEARLEAELNSADSSKVVVPVDEKATDLRNTCLVYRDPKGVEGTYDLYMVKTDVNSGPYGQHSFYKMQVLLDQIQQLPILWTRWGRVGEDGQFQRTPFSTVELATTEFCKIFKSKSGNSWDTQRTAKTFVPHDGKYHLQFTKQKNATSELLKPIETIIHKLSHPTKDTTVALPPLRANKYIQSLVKLLCDTSLIHQTMNALGYTDEKAENEMASKLSKSVLEAGYEKLKQISALIPQLAELQNKLNAQYTAKSQLDYNLQQQEQAKMMADGGDGGEDGEEKMDIDEDGEDDEENEDEEDEDDEDAPKKKKKGGKAPAAKKSAPKKASAGSSAEKKDDSDELSAADMKPIEEAILKIQAEKQKVDEEISSLTNAFFQLVPQPQHRNSAIRAITTKEQCQQYVSQILQFLDLHVTKKLLLACQLQPLKHHPYDYVYSGLGISLQRLSHREREYKWIEKYIYAEQSRQSLEIYNIYALSRRGEDERFEPFKKMENRTLLWHGSGLVNFNGILSQGLRIAPPEASVSGYAFGKGVYFADKFSKSYGYCRDFQGSFGYNPVTAQQNYGYGYNRYGNSSSSNNDDQTRSKCLLLCEVALGTPYLAHESEYMEGTKKGTNSTKAIGSTAPNPKKSIVTNEGLIIPNGPIAPVPTPEDWDSKKGSYVCTGDNEFIVYNEGQCRMRYLIQVGPPRKRYLDRINKVNQLKGRRRV